MKEVVTKDTDALTQEDFHGTFPKMLERYKCIAAGGDYFEGDLSSTCVQYKKVPMRKKSVNLLKDPRIYIYIYIIENSTNHHLAIINLFQQSTL